MGLAILQVSETLLRDVFMLPENYALVGASYNMVTGCFNFLVASQDIPRVDDAAHYPELNVTIVERAVFDGENPLEARTRAQYSKELGSLTVHGKFNGETEPQTIDLLAKRKEKE